MDIRQGKVFDAPCEFRHNKKRFPTIESADSFVFFAPQIFLYFIISSQK